MANCGIFPVSRFAKLTRTTRDTLLYYDRIGLMSPIERGENKYRCYSSGFKTSSARSDSISMPSPA